MATAQCAAMLVRLNPPFLRPAQTRGISEFDPLTFTVTVVPFRLAYLPLPPSIFFDREQTSGPVACSTNVTLFFALSKTL